MNQIEYLFLLFCILFLLEKKAINILLSFVAIIITTAFILPTIILPSQNKNNLSLIIESEYFSYALILVQVSALTILFGFIIMLFPNLAQSNPKILTTFEPSTNSIMPFKGENISIKDAGSNPIFKVVKIILIPTGLILGLLLSSEIKEILTTLNMSSLLTNSIYETTSLNTINFSSYDTINFNTMFLRKLGTLFYSVEGYIIKLIVLTVILLLAIISLFFIIT